MRLIHLIKSTFPSLKIIVDTLIDIGSAKHQNITSYNQAIASCATFLLPFF